MPACASQNKGLDALRAVRSARRRVILTPLPYRFAPPWRFTFRRLHLASRVRPWKAGTDPSRPFFSHHWSDVAARGGSPPRDPTDDSQEIGCFYFARFSLMQRSNFSFSPFFFSLSLLRYPALSCNPPLVLLSSARWIEPVTERSKRFLESRHSTVLVFRIVIRLLPSIRISICRCKILFTSG